MMQSPSCILAGVALALCSRTNMKCTCVQVKPTRSLAMAPLTRNAARDATLPLPPELWGIIIGHLPIRDWYHLALASKMLWQLQPERICMTESCTGKREGAFLSREALMECHSSMHPEKE